jgi:hypothetical protein
LTLIFIEIKEFQSHKFPFTRYGLQKLHILKVTGGESYLVAVINMIIVSPFWGTNIVVLNALDFFRFFIFLITKDKRNENNFLVIQEFCWCNLFLLPEVEIYF